MSESIIQQILYYHPESESYFIDSAGYFGSPGDDGLSVEIGKCDDLAALRRELEQAREERDTARMCLANEEQSHAETKAEREKNRKLVERIRYWQDKTVAQRTLMILSDISALLEKEYPMSEYKIRRDVHGYAEAIERDGYTVLQLNPGTTRNEEQIEKIVSDMNQFSYACREAKLHIDLTESLKGALGPTPGHVNYVEWAKECRQSVDDIITLRRELEQAREERDTARAEVARLREVLLGLSRRKGECWCDMAIGNPMLRDHTDGCKAARAALTVAAAPEKPKDDPLGLNSDYQFTEEGHVVNRIPEKPKTCRWRREGVAYDKRETCLWKRRNTKRGYFYDTECGATMQEASIEFNNEIYGCCLNCGLPIEEVKEGDCADTSRE